MPSLKNVPIFRPATIVYLLAVFFSLLNTASADVTVDTVAELVEAVTAANSGGDSTILIADGEYALDGAYLRITADGVTLGSASGSRSAVVLDGNYQTTEIVQILASNVTVADLTLQRAQDHPVHVMAAADRNVTGTRLENLHIIDPGQQALKINTSAGGYTADQGGIRDCLIELTAAGRSYVWERNGSCYTGGIDAHQATGWTVQDNEIRGFWCSNGLSEHAVHFWHDSVDTLVERNLIIDCDRGIGFGLGSEGHEGGVIQNNMIYHPQDHGFSDVGIGLESARNALVYNNTIFQEHGYQNSIEYRWSASTGIEIRNNLSNRAISARDGASASLGNNITGAQSHWFADTGSGDLHLAAKRSGVTDAGTALTQVSDDFDQDSRPQGPGADIGADEYLALASGSGGLVPVLYLLLGPRG